jgi:GLPGLI family protein
MKIKTYYSIISLFITIILCVNFSYSQQKEGRIVYKSKIVKLTDDDKSPLNALDDVLEGNDYVEFELLFRNEESVYKIVSNLDKEDYKLDLSKILLGARYTYYNNVKTNELFYQLEAYGAFFLIDYSKTKWVLTNENKKIGKYNCYKATTIKIVRNSRGTFKHNVVAWYTPEIQVHLGPKGYHGLPGLILELQEKNKIYVAKNISLIKSDSDIPKPIKGKIITQEDFDNIGMKMDEERKRN